MIKSYSFILLLIFSFPVWSQDQVENKPSEIVFGLEQDVLPYLLKGYIITGWTGREYFRYRFSYASATTPDFIHAENVNSDQVKAFGISFEYFIKPHFEGLWFGPGIGYWTNYVQFSNNDKLKNESVIFSFGGGYNFPIKKWLYFSPWVALHTRVSGNDVVKYAGNNYQPAILTPELSVKLGIKFP